jgi:hypothetical protein
MLAPTAVAGIAAAIGGYVNGGRDDLPSLQFEIIYEYAPKNGPKALEFNLIHRLVSRGGDADRQVPEQFTLVEVLDLLTSSAPRWLAQQQRDARFTIVGFALMYDEPLTFPTNHGAGDDVLDPAVTRVVVAVDVDGRRYEMLLDTGQPAQSVQVSEPGTPLPDDAASPRPRNRRAAWSALTQIVDIATAIPGLQPDAADSDGTEEADRDVLVAGELVTVTGDRFDDDERKQLWVVVDYFDDYTIAVLGGNGYQWARIPRGELAPAAPQWIRRVIRGDRTYGYIGADSTEPVLLDDEFYQWQPGRYQLTRVYRLAGQVLRVRVYRHEGPEQSRAEALVLNPTGGFTVLTATPPGDWHAATPPSAESGEPLSAIAEQLLQRAARILAPPADPAINTADS